MRTAAVLGALAACGVGSTVLRAGEPPASGLDVATEYVEYARWSKERNRADPTDKIAQSPPRGVPLSPDKPAGFRRGPEGGGALYGSVLTAGRAACVAFLPTSATKATVAVDWN